MIAVQTSYTVLALDTSTDMLACAVAAWTPREGGTADVRVLAAGDHLCRRQSNVELVSTALDALSHAMEGYCTPKCTDIPALFGEKAVALIWEGLCQLFETKEIPDYAMREQLYYGSLYAGITLAYCGTAFPHPLGYVLTEGYGTAHGTACAVFLPAFLRRALEYTPEKANRLLAAMGTDADTFCKTVQALTDCDVIMTKEEIAAACTRWDAAVPNNFKQSPGGFTKEEAQALIEALLAISC